MVNVGLGIHAVIFTIIYWILFATKNRIKDQFITAYLGVILCQNLLHAAIVEVASWQETITEDQWGITTCILVYTTSSLVLAPSISYILFFYMPLTYGVVIFVNLRYDLAKK